MMVKSFAHRVIILLLWKSSDAIASGGPPGDVEAPNRGMEEPG